MRSHDDTSGHDIEILQTQSLMELALTHSLFPFEFSDSNRGLSLWGQKIKAMFILLCKNSSQTFSSGHIPFLHHSACIWPVMRELRRFGIIFQTFRAIGSGSILLNRIGFWPCAWLGLQRRLLTRHWSFHAPQEITLLVSTMMSGYLLLTKDHYLRHY